MVPGGLQEPFWHHFGSQNGAKMAPKMTKNELPEASGDPLGTPWAPGGRQDAIKIDPGALLEASGGEKKSLVLAGGAPEKFLDHFSSS